MIKQLARILLLLSPIALLATSKPAITLQEIRRDHGIPLRPGSEEFFAAVELAIEATAPFTATPVPLSIQAPQNTLTVSSSLTAQQEGNVEHEEQKEKADEGKEPKLYTSDEDAKILFEVMNRLQDYRVDTYKKAVQAGIVSRFFEAIDAHDTQLISAMAKEDINLIFQIDHRRKYRDHLRSNPAQRILQIYHQNLSSEKPAPKWCWQEIGLTGDRLQQMPWHEDNLIDAKSLAFVLTKDVSNKNRKIYAVSDEITWDELRVNEHLNLIDLRSLLAASDALSQAIISGHVEVVDALLNTLITELDALILDTEPIGFSSRPRATQVNEIYLPRLRELLDVLLVYSTIAHSSEKCQKAAAEIYNHIGLKTIPQYENYPTIARKLVRAFIHVAQIAEQYWWPEKCEQWAIHAKEPWRCNVDFLRNRSPLAENLEALLRYAMKHGSIEIFQIIAEEMADIKSDPRNGVHQPTDPRHYDQFELMARDAVNGEKLGILLSLNAHAESAPHMLAMGMLSRVEKNPRLLSRLKKYIRRYQKTDALINTQASGHLLPVLAPCVAHYVHYMPADIQNYILNLRPAIQAAQPAGQQENDNEGILGEHMAALMLQQSRNDGE